MSNKSKKEKEIFKKNLAIWKSSFIRSQKSDSEVSKVNPRFKKNHESSKIGQKSEKYLRRDLRYGSSFKW